MRKSRTIATAVAAVGVALVGSVAAVRQQVPPTLDLDSLGNGLGLSAEVKESIASDVGQLNALLARQEQIRQEHQDLWTRLQDVEQSIAQALTPEQQRGFGAALRRAWGQRFGMGLGVGSVQGGHMGHGSHMGLGAGPGGGIMGPGAMGTHMGPGWMGSGAHMGSGRMFGRSHGMGGGGAGVGAGPSGAR